MTLRTVNNLFFGGILAGMLIACEDINDVVNPVPTPPKTQDEQPNPNNPPPGQTPGQENGISTLAKGYQSQSGNWSVSRQYEYNANGKMSKVIWESRTPFTQTGSYVYAYDENGNIASVTDHFGDVKQYVWENNRVIRENKIDNNFIAEYKSFTYDNGGRISSVAEYYLKHEGHYSLRGVTEYLYFTDGNLYKSMFFTYDPYNNRYELTNTKVYEFYMDAPNPFPMVEVVPGIVMQIKLPGKHSVITGNQTIDYTLTYTFRSDGYPLSRTASSIYGNEHTTYSYY